MALKDLLDTNIISALKRCASGELSRRIAVAGEETVCTSVIVPAEQRFVAAKSASKPLIDRIEIVFSAIDTFLLELTVVTANER